jgi:hypothetical protein
MGSNPKKTTYSSNGHLGHLAVTCPISRVSEMTPYTFSLHSGTSYWPVTASGNQRSFEGTRLLSHRRHDVTGNRDGALELPVADVRNLPSNPITGCVTAEEAAVKFSRMSLSESTPSGTICWKISRPAIPRLPDHGQTGLAHITGLSYSCRPRHSCAEWRLIVHLGSSTIRGSLRDSYATDEGTRASV